MLTGNKEKDNKNVRAIYDALSDSKENILDDVFTPYKSVENFDAEFNKRMWGEGMGNSVLQFFSLSPWDTYWEGEFERGSFTDYLEFAEDFYDEEKVFRSFCVFIYYVARREEISSKSKLEDFLKVAKRWFQKRVFWLVWQGKEKEYLLGEALEYRMLDSGLKIRKTTQDEDIKYMVDFIVEKDKKVVYGISVKGETYRNTSKYREEGDKKESRGTERFKRDFKAKTVVAIASLNDEKNSTEALQITNFILGEVSDE